jgi:quercetin 2,3-dioxygenase
MTISADISLSEHDPMIERRPFANLGGEKLDWLDTHHHFSFAQYRDPARMNWGALRVWNDDEIAPGTGFPPHGHADMEIVTYVRQGAISHEDSLGNKGQTAAGDVQVMSAGSGIRHAEYNRGAEPTHIFQIWIVPTHAGGAPSWGTRPFPQADRAGRLVALASGEASDTEALPIRADARILGARLRKGQVIEYPLRPGRHAYLVPSDGVLEVNGVRIEPRDGAAIRDEAVLRLAAIEDAELVLVDAA